MMEARKYNPETLTPQEKLDIIESHFYATAAAFLGAIALKERQQHLNAANALLDATIDIRNEQQDAQSHS